MCHACPVHPEEHLQREFAKELEIAGNDECLEHGRIGRTEGFGRKHGAIVATNSTVQDIFVDPRPLVRALHERIQAGSRLPEPTPGEPSNGALAA